MALSSKRRLSRGSNNLQLPFEDEIEENEIDPMAEINSGYSQRSGNRNSGNGRRASLFGVLKNMSPSKVAAEQQRIADMYKHVIKLSSENKINEKNSWNLDLIDHMGAIIKEESQGQKGVNFQKASCTLDASVKIYSNRVDDTYATSSRILESLSRNGNDQENEDPDAPKKATRVGSKKASNRLNITNTIEKNVDNLNAVKVEHDQVVDPAFQQMSLAFDEGGAKGMLLSNLRISQKSCNLVFASIPSQSVVDTLNMNLSESSKSSSSSSIDLSNLLSSIDIPVQFSDISNLSNLTICPGLYEYRKTLHVPSSTIGVVPLGSCLNQLLSSSPSSSMVTTDVSTNTTANVTANTTTAVSNINSIDITQQPVRQYSDDLDEYDDFGESNYFSPDIESYDSNIPVSGVHRISTDNSSNQVNIVKSSKIQWSTVFGETNTSLLSSSSNMDNNQEMLKNHSDDNNSIVLVSSSSEDLQNIPVISNNDYAFVNLDILNKTNAWAGAKHWKYATRSRNKVDSDEILTAVVTNAAEVDENESSEINKNLSTNANGKKGGKKGKTSKKEKFTIDFMNMTLESIDRSIFTIPSQTTTGRTKATDSTLLTSSAIEKMQDSTEDLLLPSDEKVSIQDLCRLFILPNLILPPPATAEVLRQTVINLSKSKLLGNVSAMHRKQDIIWGQVQSVSFSSSSSSNQRISGRFSNSHVQNSNNDSDDNVHDYGDYEDYEVDANINVNDMIEPTASQSSSIAAGLVQAKRIVEKIEVNYATSAKRVNVRKLKHDIWNYLDNGLLSPHDEENIDENVKLLPGKRTRDLITKDKDKNKESYGTTTPSSTMSFKGMLRDMISTQSQKEATLPFYFICLLHLANEKVLKIENSAGRDMSDLFISKDI